MYFYSRPYTSYIVPTSAKKLRVCETTKYLPSTQTIGFLSLLASHHHTGFKLEHFITNT